MTDVVAPSVRPRIHPLQLPRVSRLQAARRAAGTAAVFGVGASAAPLVWLRSRGRARGAALYGPALRRAVERLGPTYVKLGQLLASSPSIAGEELAEELRGLLDRGRGIPVDDVRRIVEEDAGRPFGDLFTSLDPVPHAAASLAVVHRAVLHDARPVAVKVLRPGAAESIAADLAVLVPLFARLAKLAPVGIVASLPGAVHGLAEQLAEELDLRNEARTMAWFASMLEVIGADGVLVPDVVTEASGRRVLTMEFIEGTSVDDLAAIDELGIDATRSIEALLRAWFAVTLCTGTFHGDLHAGNLLFTPQGEVALLDWGILGRMDDASWRFLRRAIEGALGEEAAWDDVRAHVMPTIGADVARVTGLDEDQIFTLIRAQILAIMTAPFRELNLMALAPTAGSLDLPEAMTTRPDGVREWLRLVRDERRRLRELGSPPAPVPPHGEVLLVKQLVYFERYGKLFLGDRPLIWDEAVFRDLLAL